MIVNDNTGNTQNQKSIKVLREEERKGGGGGLIHYQIL